MLTDAERARLAEIAAAVAESRRLKEAATAGPWAYRSPGGSMHPTVVGGDGMVRFHPRYAGDGPFCAHARNDDAEGRQEWLLALVAELERRNRKLLGLPDTFLGKPIVIEPPEED